MEGMGIEQKPDSLAPFTMGLSIPVGAGMEVALVMDWHYGFKALSDLVQSGANRFNNYLNDTPQNNVAPGFGSSYFKYS